eukprot:16444964-Heterocapsa_arctica.AAC.1
MWNDQWKAAKFANAMALATAGCFDEPLKAAYSAEVLSMNQSTLLPLRTRGPNSKIAHGSIAASQH